MTTFLKILITLLILAVLVHLWPVLAVPFVAFLGVAILVGSVLTGGLALVAAVAIAIIAALLAGALGLAAALSPIWIPVLVIMGLVSLFRRSPRKIA